MNKENYLKELITQKYGSVKAFSEAIDIPYTTIRSILERGLGNSSINNVLSITNALGISIEFLEEIGKDTSSQILNSKQTQFDPVIQQEIELFSKLTNENKSKVMTYTKEQLLLQETAEKSSE